MKYGCCSRPVKPLLGAPSQAPQGQVKSSAFWTDKWKSTSVGSCSNETTAPRPQSQQVSSGPLFTVSMPRSRQQLCGCLAQSLPSPHGSPHPGERSHCVAADLYYGVIKHGADHATMCFCGLNPGWVASKDPPPHIKTDGADGPPRRPAALIRHVCPSCKERLEGAVVVGASHHTTLS